MADERRKFDVSLVTPEGAAYEGEAEMIIVPQAPSSTTMRSRRRCSSLSRVSVNGSAPA